MFYTFANHIVIAVAALVALAVVVAIVPAFRRAVFGFWSGTGRVLASNVDRAWGEWAPVLATRTGSNAAVLAVVGATGVTLSAKTIGYIVTAIMVGAIVWSFLRVLHGRQNAAGPVVSHVATAEARHTGDPLTLDVSAFLGVTESTANDVPPRGGLIDGNRASRDPFGDADTPRPSFGPMANNDKPRKRVTLPPSFGLMADNARFDEAARLRDLADVTSRRPSDKPARAPAKKPAAKASPAKKAAVKKAPAKAKNTGRRGR